MNPTPPPPDRAQSNESVPLPELLYIARWHRAWGRGSSDKDITEKHEAMAEAIERAAAPPISQRATGEETRHQYWERLSGRTLMAQEVEAFEAWKQERSSNYIHPKYQFEPIPVPAAPRSLPHGPGDDMDTRRLNHLIKMAHYPMVKGRSTPKLTISCEGPDDFRAAIDRSAGWAAVDGSKGA